MELAWKGKVGRRVKVTRNRFGYNIEGVPFQRVTTLLKGIPKPALTNWAAKCVAEYAVEHKDSWTVLPATDAVKLLKGVPWSKRDDAGDRGTAIHNAVEAYLTGGELPDGMTEEEFDCAIAAEAFLRQYVDKVMAVELTVFNVTHGYAGTLDLWALGKDGKTAIWDWKSSGGVYSDHAVQQTAYHHAEYAVVDKITTLGIDEAWEGTLIEWGPSKAEELGIVHVQPTGCSLYPIIYTQKLWHIFRASAFIKRWQSDTDSWNRTPKDPVFGNPVEFRPEATPTAA